jgi:hypothetical protein
MSRRRWFEVKCDKCGYVSRGGDATVGSVKHAVCQGSAETDKEPYFGDNHSTTIELCGVCFAEYMADWIWLGRSNTNAESWRETAEKRRAARLSLQKPV